MNIRLSYLYRDAHNFKEWGEIDFANVGIMRLTEIEARILGALIDGEWFIADRVGVPDLRPEHLDSDADHDLHEFGGVAELAANVSVDRDISDFLDALETCKAAGHKFAIRSWTAQF